MRIDWFAKTLLFAIAVFLGTIALRPVLVLPPVSAQAHEGYPFYFEPGSAMLRAPDGSRRFTEGSSSTCVTEKSGNFDVDPGPLSSRPAQQCSAQVTSLPARQVRIRRYR
jgi:hypothetical protein